MKYGRMSDNPQDAIW